MDEEGIEAPRQFRVIPRQLLASMTVVATVIVAITAALMAFTPVRQLIPGYGTEEIRRDARLNTLRLLALEDSLAAQSVYVDRLRTLITGEPVGDGAGTGSEDGVATATPAGEPPDMMGRSAADRGDHTEPTVTLAALSGAGSGGAVESAGRYLTGPQFPVMPPVAGLMTRGFEPEIGHFAVDVATQAGSMVRSIADGYVILADWTHEGGLALAVQHGSGYVSVYKHNQRLLKNVGDRVWTREAIAVSGNTGEVTTGPHVHFELWRDGLALDPRYYFLPM
jgi:murein DD-endopeptidase MepM/ murein hydrolase activator NlpD